MVYQYVKYARSTSGQGIRMLPVPFNRSSVLLAYGDSSWCNAVDYTSQFGVLVVITPPQVSERTCPALLLDWKSGRMQRSARSTLAAEANAADEASDRLAFCNYFCTELFYQIPAYKGTMKMEMKQATDAKSLYDLLIAENPAPLEKRSMVAVRSVQQTLPAQAIHWLPTNITHADGLTKLDMRLQQALATWCMARGVSCVKRAAGL